MSDDIVTTLGQQIAASILKQPGKHLRPDEPLLSSGLIDSFKTIDLAILVEDNFGVHLDDAELTSDHFDTLAQLAEIIRARQ